MKSRKLKSKVRVKKTEADLAVFKLIINNQGKFIIEKSMYPLNKIELHFKKENSGLINVAPIANTSVTSSPDKNLAISKS